MNNECCYIPAIIRSEHEDVMGALIALDIPRGEVMNLIVARWGAPSSAILAEVDGGRPVAAVPMGDGRWAACNIFPEQSCHSPAEAQRRLNNLLKRGRRGLVACAPFPLPV